MTGHVGTLHADRDRQQVRNSTTLTVLWTTTSWAECSCGWQGPKHDTPGYAAMQVPEWDLNEHIATASRNA